LITIKTFSVFYKKSPKDVTFATSFGDFLSYNKEKNKEVFPMIAEGCQGKPRTPTISEKICPQCGSVIEMFSIDTQVACDNCGFIAYNDTLSCVQWCAYAKKCVGEEMYEKMMAIAAQQKEQAAQEREKRKVAG
jgi:ribosomal protein S27AE